MKRLFVGPQWGALALVLASVCATSPAFSEDAAPPTLANTPNTDAVTAEKPSRDTRSDVPLVAFTHTAHGAPTRSFGAQGFGMGLVASGQKSVGGGLRVWGSPVERLTLLAEGERDLRGDLSPSATAVVRLLGTGARGWSLGVLGKFKANGFAPDVTGEIETELETGLLASYVRAGFHLDANAIAGFGLGDAGEADVEGRLRLGQDLGRFVRAGVDGQLRALVAGPRLPYGPGTWDFVAGPQVVVGSSAFFGALTAGPTSVGVPQNLGWTALASVGGIAL